jgi:hypothetical protein
MEAVEVDTSGALEAAVPTEQAAAILVAAAR